MNVLYCGALNSGFSGVQKNVLSSRGGGSLVEELGIDTGAWHTDSDDDPEGETVVVGLFRLPPGMHPRFLENQ